MIRKELAVLGRRSIMMARRPPSQIVPVRGLSSTQRVSEFAQEAKNKAAKDARSQNEMAENAKAQPSAHVQEQLEKTNNQSTAGPGFTMSSDKNMFEKGKEKLSQGAQAVKEKAGEVKEQIKETMGSNSSNAEKYNQTSGAQRGYAQTNAEKYGDTRRGEQRVAAPSDVNKDARRPGMF